MAIIKKLRHYVEVQNIVADFNFKVSVPGVVTFEAIKFFPGAPGDKLVVREGSPSGPVVVLLQSNDGEGRIDRDVAYMSAPYIYLTECTLTAGGLVVFCLRKPLQ